MKALETTAQRRWKILGQTELAAATPTAVYTVPTLRQAMVYGFYITNHDIADATINVYAVKSGDTQSAANRIIGNHAVTAGSWSELLSTRTFMLTQGESIWVESTVANVVITLTGMEELL